MLAHALGGSSPAAACRQQAAGTAAPSCAYWRRHRRRCDCAIAAREHQVLPVRLARSAKLLHRRVCNSSGAPRTVRLLQPPRSVAAYKDLEAHHSSPATFPAAPRACRNASTRCAAHAFRSPLAQRMLNVFTSLWQHWGTQLSAIISWHGQLTETPITSIRKDSVARMP